MRTERLKCPNCGSVHLKLQSIPEISMECLFSFEVKCSDCGYEGETGIKLNKKGEIVIGFKC